MKQKKKDYDCIILKFTEVHPIKTFSQKRKDKSKGEMWTITWLWIRVTLHLNGLIVCMYTCLRVTTETKRSAVSSAPSMQSISSNTDLVVTRGPWCTGNVSRTEISAGSPVDKAYCHFWNISSAILIWIRVAGEIKAMSEDVVPHLACEASAAIRHQTLSFRNALRWTSWNSDSDLRLQPLSNEIWK